MMPKRLIRVSALSILPEHRCRVVSRRPTKESGVAQAKVIDGKAVAAKIRDDVAEAARRLRNEARLTPGLATVLVGNDPSSKVYVRGKGRACVAAGLASFELSLPAKISEGALIAELEKLNGDDRV